MRPAHLCSMYVREAVRTQLAISRAIDCARHDDARVAGVAHLPDVFLGVRGVADERQFHRRHHLFESLAYFLRHLPGSFPRGERLRRSDSARLSSAHLAWGWTRHGTPGSPEGTTRHSVW